MEDRAGRRAEELYTWLFGLVGMVLFSTYVPRFTGFSDVFRAVFMTLLVAVGESTSVPIPVGVGTVSVSLPIAYTVTVLYGPAVGIWVAALGTLRVKDLQGKVPLRIVLFNRAMISISMFLFCQVYSALGGTYENLSFPSVALPFICGACIYTLANAAIITGFWSLQTKMSFTSVWRMNINWSLPSELAISPIALMMALAAQQMGPYLLILFYIPLTISKYSLDKYVEMRAAYREMATALSNAIDARDAYTSGHSERVAEYASLLAKQLRLPDDEIDIIRYVGLLHDVGKVGIRDAVMKKPGAYTFDEYEEMKNHAAIGAGMLEGLRFIGRGQDWVRYHHERWDGKGFPKGLAGEAIPLEARILACADSFDAMTTDRPYKEKMDFGSAKAELLRCSGTQFDPKVVEAMLKIVDRLAVNATKAMNAADRK